jgi:hypothetical protein
MLTLERGAKPKASLLSPPQKTFPFLSLPAELRNAIYTDYIRDAFLSFKCTEHNQQIKFKTSRFHKLQLNGIGLLHTNKQIQSEASSVLYGMVSFAGQLANYLTPVDYNGPEIQNLIAGNDGFKVPGIYKSFVDNPDQSFSPLAVAQASVRSQNCVSKLDPKILSKFRTMELGIYWGEDFPCPEQYNAIRAFLVGLQSAIAKENATNSTPMSLRLNFLEPYCHRLNSVMTMNQKIERWKILCSTIDTLLWIFEGTERLTLHHSLVSRLQHPHHIISWIHSTRSTHV